MPPPVLEDKSQLEKYAVETEQEMQLNSFKSQTQRESHLKTQGDLPIMHTDHGSYTKIA